MQCLIFICRENGQIRVRENDVLQIPKLKDLNARLLVLSNQQKAKYEKYREARKEMQRWQAVQQSVHSSLKQLEKEKHRGGSR